MSRLDYCHAKVVRTLEKADWHVNAFPFRVDTGERYVYVDIEATKQVNGNRLQVMLAEVKCFTDKDSTTRELYVAIGQYIVYRAIPAEMNIAIPLYLAIPDEAYNVIFDTAVRRAIADSRIKLLIVNLETETIVQWQE